MNTSVNNTFNDFNMLSNVQFLESVSHHFVVRSATITSSSMAKYLQGYVHEYLAMELAWGAMDTPPGWSELPHVMNKVVVRRF